MPLEGWGYGTIDDKPPGGAYRSRLPQPPDGKAGTVTIHKNATSWYYVVMASPVCSICQRTDLTAIDAALAAGGTLIPTSSHFGVSKSALGRHRANCLAPKLKAAAKVLTPVREIRSPVERARAIAMGDMPSPHEVLTLTGLLDRLGRSLDRLEGAADTAATDNLHSALAALSGQIHRGVESAAKLQGFGNAPEAQQQPKFSVNIIIPQAMQEPPTPFDLEHRPRIQ